MAHVSRKRFGQHFLHDEAVVDRIVRAIAPQRDDRMVEIGPGLAALTAPLLQHLYHLHVIELDRDLAARLRSGYSAQRLTVHQADALAFDFASLGSELRVVGNLPYNISSPLLFHLVNHAARVRDQHFMLQRELVARMVAPAGSAEYGRLSVMLQARYRMSCLFDVAPSAFEPPPRVMSSVVRMRPLPESRPQPRCDTVFEAVVARVFSQRRKMLRRSLAGWLPALDWDALGFAPTVRPQDLSVSQFIALADQVFDRGLMPALSAEKPVGDAD